MANELDIPDDVFFKLIEAPQVSSDPNEMLRSILHIARRSLKYPLVLHDAGILSDRVIHLKSVALNALEGPQPAALHEIAQEDLVELCAAANAALKNRALCKYELMVPQEASLALRNFILDSSSEVLAPVI